MASNESPDPPLPAVVEAVTRVLGTAQPLPRPVQQPAAPRAERPLRRAGGAHRDRQRLGRDPDGRRRGAARARRRARLRMAVVLGLPAPGGRVGRDRDPRRRLDADERHDLAAMAQEITVATRLAIVCNPNNPTSTALPARRDRRLHRRGPAPRRGDPRRGLLRVQHARRPRRVARPPQAHPNLVLLRTFSKVYGLCGLRVGFALCGSEDFVTAVNQVRQPFFCNAAAQAAAIEALRHQDAVDRARGARDRRARRDRGGAARAGHQSAESQANFAGSTSRCADGEEPADVEAARRARARRARRARARGRRARQARRAARDLRDAGAERALPARAGRAALNTQTPARPSAAPACVSPTARVSQARAGASARPFRSFSPSMSTLGRSRSSQRGSHQARLAEQRHHGRHERHPDDERVGQDAEGQRRSRST